MKVQNEQSSFRIALPTWNGRISPLFDSSQCITVAEIDKNVLKKTELIQLTSHMPHSRALELDALNIDVLICGAISQLYASMIETHGIQMISFVAGNVDEVIEMYLQNKLDGCQFRMPGCGRRRRRCRGHGKL